MSGGGATLPAHLVFGNLTIDDTVFPDGSTAMGTMGGNAVYATAGARLWTHSVAMVSRLGTGYPDRLLRDLERAGLRTDGLIPSAHHHIRQWQLYDVEGGRTYVPLRSSATYADLTPAPDEIPARVCRGLRSAHVAPLRVDLQAALVEWLKARGATVTLDPHFDSVAGEAGEAGAWAALLPSVDAFLPSREEAEALLGCWPGPAEAAVALSRLGPAVVCVKLGAEGCVAYDARDRRVWRLPSPARRVVDVTGCGDAFCGGFLVGWAASGDVARGCALGSAAAAVVAGGYGAAHALACDPDEARVHLDRIAVGEA